MRSIAVVFAAVFSRLVFSIATRCALDPNLPGIGEGILFESSTKLSVAGFISPLVSYVTLPTGSDPYIKILGASEEPIVRTEGGVLHISTGTCQALDPTPAPITPDTTGTPGTVAPTDPSDDTTSSPASSAASTMFTTGLAASMFAPRGLISTTLLVTSLLGNLSPVWGDGHLATEDCAPTLEIEISLPAGTETTPKFGQTDYEVKATVETSIWGWFDPNREPVVTVQSGETVTLEGITSVCGHDYAKMIRGDPAVEEFFAWYPNETLVTKASPKLPGSGPHPVTGPVEVAGAMPGDVLQVDILELDPRKNPVTGKTFGSNAQKFNGYHFRFPYRDGTEYVVGNGAYEALTIMEFIEDENSNMLWGKPVYMFRPPNTTLPDNTSFIYDNLPAIYPHVYNYGYNMSLLEDEPIEYPPGFDGFVLAQDTIEYLSPDPAGLDWKVPLRPHMGVLAVTPNNTERWNPNGLNTVPPGQFGGNVDDWRVGKGGTMYYVVEIPGAMLYMGDTHAAQGDSELAGTAMETSLTAKLRLTLHKADSLPKKVSTISFPLLETSTEYVIHGFAYPDFLNDLENPTDICSVGGSLDLAMEDCFVRTRDWLMDVYDLTEEETIALMSMGIDFGVTQVVDGNWGVHSDIPKWLFESMETPFDYSCTTSKTPGRESRILKQEDRQRALEQHGVDKSPEGYADELFTQVTKKCAICHKHPARTVLAHKMLDAKLDHLDKVNKNDERARRMQEYMENYFKAATKQGGKLRR